MNRNFSKLLAAFSPLFAPPPQHLAFPHSREKQTREFLLLFCFPMWAWGEGKCEPDTVNHARGRSQETARGVGNQRPPAPGLTCLVTESMSLT